MAAPRSSAASRRRSLERRVRDGSDRRVVLRTYQCNTDSRGGNGRAGLPSDEQRRQPHGVGEAFGHLLGLPLAIVFRFPDDHAAMLAQIMVSGPGAPVGMEEVVDLN